MTEPTKEEGKRPRRSRKRTLVVSACVAFGLLLIVLVAGPPVIASVTKSSIESSLAERFDARVEIEDLSFGWSGAVSLRGLRVVPDGFSDPLLEIPEADAAISLLSALGGSYIARIEVNGPRILVEKGADGRFNYERPGGPVILPNQEEEEAEPEAAPFIDVTLKIRNGRLVARGAGGETVYEGLEADVRIDTLEKPISLRLAARDPDGGRIDAEGEMALSDFDGSGELAVKNLSFRNLSGLASLYGLADSLDGTLDAMASVADERFELAVTTRDLLVVRAGTAPLDLIVATVDLKGVPEAGGGIRIEKGTIETPEISARLSGSIGAGVGRNRKGRLALEATVNPTELSRWFKDFHLGGRDFRLVSELTLDSGTALLTGKAYCEELALGEGEDRQTVRATPVDFSVTVNDKGISAGLTAGSLNWSRGGFVVKAGVESTFLHSGETTEGTTTIRTIEVTDPEKRSAKEKGITVRHRVETTEGFIVLKTAEIDSGFLKGGVTGKVGRGAEVKFEGLRGSFTYHPSRLGAVLAPWLPGTLAGKEERTLELSLDGKAGEVDLFALLRGSAGEVHLDLAPFTMTGLSVSGRSRLELKDGRLAGRTPLAVNGGATDFDLLLDFRAASGRPKSALRFKAAGVQANGSMGPLLSKINPVLYVSGVDAALGGVVRSDFDLAWDGPVEGGGDVLWKAAPERLSGTGSLAIESLSVQGSPLVGLLLDVLAGTGNRMDGDLRAAEIVVGGGKCRYRDMTLRLKKYEVRFTGWVGFDGRMELMLETPITERLGNRYPVLRRFFGKTLFLPVTGTVSKPKVDLGGAVQEFLRRNAQGALLDELLRRATGDKDGKEPSKDPIRGLIDRFLRGKQNKDEK